MLELILAIFASALLAGWLSGRRLINKHTNRYMYQMYDGFVLRRQLRFNRWILFGLQHMPPENGRKV